MRWGDSKKMPVSPDSSAAVRAAAAFAGFDGEEAAEAEGVAGETGADQRGDHRGRAGQDFEGRAGFDAGLHEAVAGVRDAGHAGIADDGDGFTGAGGGDEFGRAAGFVVLVQGDERFAGDAVMGEQRRGMAGVLAGDAVGGFQDFHGTQRDVAEVADGRGNDHDAAGWFAWRGSVGFAIWRSKAALQGGALRRR